MIWPQKCFGGVRVMNAPSPANVRRLTQGIMPMLRRMSSNGMTVDVQALQTIDRDLADEQSDLMFQIEGYRSEAHQVNLNSGKQLAELLFRELGLDDTGLKRVKDKSRPKLDKKATAKLKEKHEVVRLYAEWKERQTIRTNFCQALPKQIHPDGKLHPHFQTTRAATRRLACEHPNLTQIPTRSKIGKRIRNAFRPSPGKTYVSVDQSQIELRVIAHNSGDEQMIKQFYSAHDFHTQTAALVFRVPIDEVDPETQRKPAKNMNFGVVYGITPSGLLEQFIVSGALDWDLESCEALIADWFRVYGGVGNYIDLEVRRAKAHLYLWDMWGGVRQFPELLSSDAYVRAKAEREIGNTSTQSGAQGCMQLSMIELWDLIDRERVFGDRRPEPLVQIHDELLFEMDETIVGDFIALTQAVMNNCVRLEVPIESAAKSGTEWGKLE